jgi:hypothetical protein
MSTTFLLFRYSPASTSSTPRNNAASSCTRSGDISAGNIAGTFLLALG